jgi:hypothetical protein
MALDIVLGQYRALYCSYISTLALMDMALDIVLGQYSACSSIARKHQVP